ncbi:MAG: nucleotide-binding universal stress UspA family protein [Myxococcota bacterium]|jgi:nucleotide-binding universal stress UspA family protein
MNFKSIERVIVPVDLEDPTPDALGAALEIAGDPKGVHVLYVLPVLGGSMMPRIDDAKRVGNSEKALRGWLEEQGAPGTVQTHVKVGEVGHITEALCSTIDAQLVVIRSHSRTGLRRALLGSVADRITRLVPCPVLLLKAPRD